MTYKQYWKNWSTRDDLESLARWEAIFGENFRAVFVFAYNIVGDRSPLPAEQLFMYRDGLYAFLAVLLGDYAPRRIPFRRDGTRWPCRSNSFASTPGLPRSCCDCLDAWTVRRDAWGVRRGAWTVRRGAWTVRREAWEEEANVMAVQSYRELEVWNVAMDMAAECYRVTRAFPKEELFGMTSQIRRAAASIPANIAEGQGRDHTKEFLNHLSIARGSLKELETHLLLCQRVGLLAETGLPLMKLCERISQMLSRLRQSLEQKL